MDAAVFGPGLSDNNADYLRPREYYERCWLR